MQQLKAINLRFEKQFLEATEVSEKLLEIGYSQILFLKSKQISFLNPMNHGRIRRSFSQEILKKQARMAYCPGRTARSFSKKMQMNPFLPVFLPLFDRKGYRKTLFNPQTCLILFDGLYLCTGSFFEEKTIQNRQPLSLRFDEELALCLSIFLRNFLPQKKNEVSRYKPYCLLVFSDSVNQKFKI